MQVPVFENTGFRKQTHSNSSVSRHYSIDETVKPDLMFTAQAAFVFRLQQLLQNSGLVQVDYFPRKLKRPVI